MGDGPFRRLLEWLECLVRAGGGWIRREPGPSRLVIRKRHRRLRESRRDKHWWGGKPPALTLQGVKVLRQGNQELTYLTRQTCGAYCILLREAGLSA